jgi:hypothetical protein
MAEENEGVDLSPAADDVNTDGGFGAALAERGLGPIEQEFPRSDDDRFVEQAQPGVTPLSPQAPPEEAPPEGGEAAPEVDPAVAAFLAQHGDDPQAALAAALQEREHAQGLIGRQGQELGDLRQQMAHLQGRMDELGQAAYEPVPEPITAELQDSLATMFDEQGAEQAMGWLADNRPDLIEAGINVWAEQDPFQAGRFASRYDRFLQDEQQQAEQVQQPQPQEDPILAQMRAREQFTMLADGARSQLGISDEDWPAVREHVVPAFNDEKTSPLIKNAIISPDPQTQFQGMVEIVREAHGRAINVSQQTAEAQAQQQAADEAEQRKLQATVATGSLRPVPEGKPLEELTSEERIALFKQSLLAPPSTSVLQGLTFGPQQ